jgi:hypothetical protein
MNLQFLVITLFLQSFNLQPTRIIEKTRVIPFSIEIHEMISKQIKQSMQLRITNMIEAVLGFAFLSCLA